MKKALSLAFTLLFLFNAFSFSAFAAERPFEKTETYTEYCEDGGYYVIEIGTYLPFARASTKSGYKTATYYNSSNKAIWAVQVQGYFSYTGSSATATSASATVYTYDSKVEFGSKNAYVSGATAVGTATMKYGSVYTDKTVRLTCARNGNLS